MNFDLYGGLFTGPTNFGSGLGAFANTGSGDFVGINVLNGLLSVPQGYVSGAALSDSMTFENATFDSLGVTRGHYVIRWRRRPTVYFTRNITSGAGRFPMAAQQFLCSVALCLAWLPCGANWVAKVLVVS